MTEDGTTVTIKLCHRSSIPHHRWVDAIGWRPANQIDGATWDAGSNCWYDDDTGEEVAGLVLWCHPDAEEGANLAAWSSGVLICSCGDCRILGRAIADHDPDAVV